MQDELAEGSESWKGEEGLVGRSGLGCCHDGSRLDSARYEREVEH